MFGILGVWPLGLLNPPLFLLFLCHSALEGKSDIVLEFSFRAQFAGKLWEANAVVTATI